MENVRKNIRKGKGITLIALVITVIILLILAGISIAELTGTGIFAKAKEAKQKYKDAEELENQMLADYERQLNSLGKSTVGSGGTEGDGGGGEQHDEPTPSNPSEPAQSMAEARKDDMFDKTVNSTVADEYENQVVVPAGFKITEDANNVTEGIVIEDREGNQFVWIPVGEVKTKGQPSETITLSRYTFDANGNKTDKGATEIDDDYNSSYKHKEEQSSSTGNPKAKNLEEFKTSVSQNHGYYIGRYEARKNSSNKVTEKATDTVWNNITQPNASTQCQIMYTGNNFTSDLMNSYAWDTAIVFLQEFDNRTTSKGKKYSRQNSLNTGSLASTGTNNTDTKDVICNIYDMASNVKEWTTETSTNSNGPCTLRGGYYIYSNSYTSYRDFINIASSTEYFGFRPILYCSTES